MNEVNLVIEMKEAAKEENWKRKVMKIAQQMMMPEKWQNHEKTEEVIMKQNESEKEKIQRLVGLPIEMNDFVQNVELIEMRELNH